MFNNLLVILIPDLAATVSLPLREGPKVGVAGQPCPYGFGSQLTGLLACELGTDDHSIIGIPPVGGIYIRRKASFM